MLDNLIKIELFLTPEAYRILEHGEPYHDDISRNEYASALLETPFNQRRKRIVGKVQEIRERLSHDPLGTTTYYENWKIYSETWPSENEELSNVEVAWTYEQIQIIGDRYASGDYWDEKISKWRKSNELDQTRILVHSRSVVCSLPLPVRLRFLVYLISRGEYANTQYLDDEEEKFDPEINQLIDFILKDLPLPINNEFRGVDEHIINEYWDEELSEEKAIERAMGVMKNEWHGLYWNELMGWEYSRKFEEWEFDARDAMRTPFCTYSFLRFYTWDDKEFNERNKECRLWLERERIKTSLSISDLIPKPCNPN